jgi:peptide subunit release factor RF-3
MQATQHLQEAQEKIDMARAKVHTNPSLAVVLLADADRSTSDATTCVERIQRYVSLSRAKPITGRWPIGAAKQRDDTYGAAETAIRILTKAQEKINQARDKVQYNPSLAETLIVDTARMHARVLTLTERISRLMTEAAIGRE